MIWVVVRWLQGFRGGGEGGHPLMLLPLYHALCGLDESLVLATMQYMKRLLALCQCIANLLVYLRL